MNKYQYLERLREPSTWGAFAALAGFFGAQYADPGFQTSVVTIGVTLSGLLGMLIREKK